MGILLFNGSSEWKSAGNRGGIVSRIKLHFFYYIELPGKIQCFPEVFQIRTAKAPVHRMHRRFFNREVWGSGIRALQGAVCPPAAGQERRAPAPDPILDKAAEFQVSLDEIEVLRPREALPNDVLRRGLLVEIIRRNQITHYKQLLFQKILIFSLRRELLCCTLIIEQSWEKVKTV